MFLNKVSRFFSALSLCGVLATFFSVTRRRWDSGFFSYRSVPAFSPSYSINPARNASPIYGATGGLPFHLTSPRRIEDHSPLKTRRVRFPPSFWWARACLRPNPSAIFFSYQSPRRYYRLLFPQKSQVHSFPPFDRPGLQPSFLLFFFSAPYHAEPRFSLHSGPFLHGRPLRRGRSRRIVSFVLLCES